MIVNAACSTSDSLEEQGGPCSRLGLPGFDFVSRAERAEKQARRYSHHSSSLEDSALADEKPKSDDEDSSRLVAIEFRLLVVARCDAV
ncbi:hypothetical protein JMJ77_0003891 [Colletotrichum scovillei]|uniref:Uncharacterized protein n=1 Tax=Colletotrichum scovillei TaxID=1209932 RepID=A0A9P7QXG2_9PEZI|nr:hypothetical protein JMJ77_0003891 [Colletotrichum scovillei]KAG7049140.1 hypothetical protein JMJ78_0013123 [Colletotrichum scovillei]KAG7063881.1 hypothetical protein JMJ76_0006929 [Colletotrichum scovillei]